MLITFILSATLPQVVEESRAHGDILQEDFVDSYLNLTLKTVMGLKWGSQHCRSAKYFMKTDDDMFINLPAIMTYLTEAKRERWITGESMATLGLIMQMF